MRSVPPFSMDPEFFKNNRFRPPQWRAERVMRMVTNRPSPLRPRRYDDRHVRVYRRFLMSSLAAGDDEERRSALLADLSHVHHAHRLYFDPDSEPRQIIEALLLTKEPYCEIARRFALEEQAVDYYEKLFFNVRDRLQATDWIIKVILGPSPNLVANRRGVMTGDQRGLLYRLFAYYGGPLVLDAMISGMVPRAMPEQVEDVGGWLDDAMGQLLRSRVTAAARSFQIDRHSVMRLLKLALRPKRGVKAAEATTELQPAALEYVEKFLAQADALKVARKPPDAHQTGQTCAASAVDPPSQKGQTAVTGIKPAAPPRAMGGNCAAESDITPGRLRHRHKRERRRQHEPP